MTTRRRVLLALVTPLVALSSCGRSDNAGTPHPAGTPPPAAASVPEATGSMRLDATIAGTKYAMSGDGECAHAEDAAIHDIQAGMWHATLRSDANPLSYINLTIWQFRQGAPSQFSLGLQAGGVFRHAATITGATIVGRGTATVDSRGDSAVLHAAGTDGKGAAFDVTLRCGTVTKAVD